MLFMANDNVATHLQKDDGRMSEWCTLLIPETDALAEL